MQDISMTWIRCTHSIYWTLPEKPTIVCKIWRFQSTLVRDTPMPRYPVHQHPTLQQLWGWKFDAMANDEESNCLIKLHGLVLMLGLCLHCNFAFPVYLPSVHFCGYYNTKQQPVTPALHTMQQTSGWVLQEQMSLLLLQELFMDAYSLLCTLHIT